MKTTPYDPSWIIIAILLIITILYQAEAQERRIKVGIIDSGISHSQSVQGILCLNGKKSIIPLDVGIDRHGHGTNIFGLISKNLNSKKYCINSYKVWEKDLTDAETLKYVIEGIKKATEDGVKYLNISMSGYEFSELEFQSILKAIQNNMIIIVSAGNNGSNLDIKCNIFPACYKNYIKNKNFIVVGARDMVQSNYGRIVSFNENGRDRGIPVFSGTSQATAIFTNRLLLFGDR